MAGSLGGPPPGAIRPPLGIREPAPVSAADTGVAADYARLRRSIKARGTGATLEAMLADIDG